jgi:hypothetical protein
MGKGKTIYTAEQFVKAIKGSGGIISTIAERVGCDWHTAKKWIETYPTVAQAYEDECQRINDMAVSVLMKSIKDGNTQDAKWWLARKRKTEFGEALDITSGGKPIVLVNWDEPTADRD